MSYSIGLYFDAATEKAIRSLWQEMAEKGISDYLHLSANRPHFTLAIYTDLDITKARNEIAVTASAYKPIPILFSYIGCFASHQPDLFLGPAVTAELVDIHQTVNQQLTGLGQYPDFDYYLPGQWVPHCAIAMGINFHNIQTGMEITRDILEIPVMAKIEEIGLIEFRPVKHIFSFRLGD